MKPVKKPVTMLEYESNFKLENVAERNSTVSEALPDQALTIRQMLDLFVTGRSLPEEEYREGIYDGEDDADFDTFVDETMMSRDELMHYRVKLKQHLDTVNDEYNRKEQEYQKQLKDNQDQDQKQDPPTQGGSDGME